MLVNLAYDSYSVYIRRCKCSCRKRRKRNKHKQERKIMHWLWNIFQHITIKLRNYIFFMHRNEITKLTILVNQHIMQLKIPFHQLLWITVLFANSFVQHIVKCHIMKLKFISARKRKNKLSTFFWDLPSIDNDVFISFCDHRNLFRLHFTNIK